MEKLRLNNKRKLALCLCILLVVAVSMFSITPTQVFAATLSGDIYSTIKWTGTATPASSTGTTEAESYEFYNESANYFSGPSNDAVTLEAVFTEIEDVTNYGVFECTSSIGTLAFTYTPSAEVAGQDVTFYLKATYNETETLELPKITWTITVGAVPAEGNNDATLSALTYSIEGSDENVEVPNFSSDVTDYKVWLPYGTTKGATITLSGTLNDKNAEITDNNTATASYYGDDATIVVTAENGATTKTYTVNFEIESPYASKWVYFDGTYYYSNPEEVYVLNNANNKIVFAVCHGFGGDSEGKEYAVKYTFYNDENTSMKSSSFICYYDSDAANYDAIYIYNTYSSAKIEFYDTETLSGATPVETWDIDINWVDEFPNVELEIDDFEYGTIGSGEHTFTSGEITASAVDSEGEDIDGEWTVTFTATSEDISTTGYLSAGEYEVEWKFVPNNTSTYATVSSSDTGADVVTFNVTQVAHTVSIDLTQPTSLEEEGKIILTLDELSVGQTVKYRVVGTSVWTEVKNVTTSLTIDGIDTSAGNKTYEIQIDGSDNFLQYYTTVTIYQPENVEVTIVGGVIDSEDLAENNKYDSGKEIIITVDDNAIPTGKEFASWSYGAGSVVENGDGTYTFTVPNVDVTITAIYKISSTIVGDLTIDYSAETIDGFAENTQYYINAELVTADSYGKIAISSDDYDWFGKNIRIYDVIETINGEVKTYEYSSTYVSISIPARADAPTVEVTQPTVSEGNGSITLDSAMQYLSDGETWTDGEGEAISLSAGTYYVRTAATEDSFSSEITTVKVVEFSKATVILKGVSISETANEDGTYNVGNYQVTPESVNGQVASYVEINGEKVDVVNNTATVSILENSTISAVYAYATPAISVDYETEMLGGFTANANYTINGKSYTADENGEIAIDTLWFGADIEIVKLASGETLASEAQSLAISARTSKPSGITTVDAGNDEWSISGITTEMEYRVKGDEEWITVSDTSISDIDTSAGDITYEFRYFATASAFKSISTSITLYKETQYTITIDNGETITTDSYYYGETIEGITSSADVGEEFSYWSIIGEGSISLEEDGTYTYTVGTADTSITAMFKYYGVISGKVVDAQNNALAGVDVGVYSGGELLYTIKTDDNGEYTFTNLPYGAYELIALTEVDGKAVELSMTLEVEGEETAKNIIIPTGGLTTQIDDKDTTYTTTAEGLENQLSEEEATGEYEVTITLSKTSIEVTDKQEELVANHVSSDDTSSVLVGFAVDYTYDKTSVNIYSEDTTVSTQPSSILAIYQYLPEEMWDKQVSIVRVHGGVAVALGYGASNANEYGEYYVLKGQYLIIYTKSFSEYIFAYDPNVAIQEIVTATTSSSSSSSSSSISLDHSSPVITENGGMVTVTDQNLIAVYVNGEKYEADGNEFEIDLADFGDGTYEIVAWDRYGRTTTQVFTVSGSGVEAGDSTSTDVETPAETETPSATTSPQADAGSDNTSTFPWWILAVAIAVIGGVCGYIVYKKKKQN